MKCCMGASIPGYGHSRNCLGSAGYFDEKLGTVVRKSATVKNGDGTYLLCPKCGSEDASEESEAKASADDFVTCRECGETFKARYDENAEKWIVLARDWTK